MGSACAHQGHVDGKLHTDAHRGDEDDHRDGAQLDAHQPHDAKQFHSHHGQDGDLQDGGVSEGWL